MKELVKTLHSEYGIDVLSASPTRGGFSTKAAYRVTAVDGTDFFVKIYDKHKPTTCNFVDRIDFYMPVLDRLSLMPALSGRVLKPVSTLTGAYKAETGGDVFVLFLYVNGVAPGIDGMTQKQTRELAETLALLHDAGNSLPFSSQGLDEDLSLSFCGFLLQYIENSTNLLNDINRFLSPHTDVLATAVREALRLRDEVRLGYSPLVLCHGDAHGNNVIQGDRLVLADWEDLRRAPAEADLFICDWHPHREIFLESYAKARRGFTLNIQLLFFYRLRRRIEDLWVDIQRLTYESPGVEEKTKLLSWIPMSIEEIRALMYNKR